MALGDDNPLYRDEEFARKTRHGGIIAPPTFICETNQYMDAAPNEDGYIGHHWDLPIPGSRSIRGGSEYEFFQPVRPTDRITATWRIADIREEETSTGRVLYVMSEVEFVNQDGHLLAVHRDTNMYVPEKPS